MSSQSSSQGVTAFSCFDYEKVRHIKYTELRTFSLSEQETRQPLDYYTSNSSSNGDEQWECTRAMTCTAPTVTPTRRRMIRSTATHLATSLASRRIARALTRRRMLFSLSLETQIPLEFMTFSKLRNPWGYQ